jgi:hypothetical protein
LARLLANINGLQSFRQSAGNLELFATVVTDVCGLIDSSDSYPEELLYQRLLGRVRGWQEFMRRGREGLSVEAELGLVGEICLLRYLLMKAYRFSLQLMDGKDRSTACMTSNWGQVQ